MRNETVRDAGELGARSRGLRLGILFGPAVFGVTAAGVALPSVATALDVAPATATWVLTVHALALGVATALFGRISDSLGVRTTLLAGSLILGTGAAFCVVAPSLGVLVAGRFLLASGSGATMAGALTLAASADPGQRVKVLAWFGATMALFAGSATFAGGAVTEALSWRETMVLPVLSLIGVPLCLPLASVRPASRQRVDVVGAALLASTAAAALVLIQTPTLDLSAPIVTATGLLVATTGTGLVHHVRRVPNGFVPHLLALDRTFLNACAIGFGVFGGLFGAMYAVPQLLVGTHDWSVLAVGLALLPGAVAGAALSRAAGPLAARLGGAQLLAAAAGAFALVLGVAGLSGGPAVSVVVGASLGFPAFALTQVVLTDLVSAGTEPTQRGAAMGLLNLGFLTGGAVGSATGGARSHLA
jgi:DHA2 family metal-tetracycline-proton antiporter-like MFS transporter